MGIKDGVGIKGDEAQSQGYGIGQAVPYLVPASPAPDVPSIIINHSAGTRRIAFRESWDGAQHAQGKEEQEMPRWDRSVVFLLIQKDVKQVGQAEVKNPKEGV